MKNRLLLSMVAMVVTAAASWMCVTHTAQAQGRRDFPGVVYVSGQGLFYDTFVAAEQLPPHGPFQLLVDGVTEYGPGDRGYVGGRWKVPDGNGGYNYFLCPLLPPGRPAP